MSSPTKEKRRLIQDFLPDLPQHDPYTPSKRIDPEYVPYYVTNFEYALTCVIDCTDDKNLFNDEDNCIGFHYFIINIKDKIASYLEMFNIFNFCRYDE